MISVKIQEYTNKPYLMKQLTSKAFSIKYINIMEMNIAVALMNALHIISPEIYVLKHIDELTNIGTESY